MLALLMTPPFLLTVPLALSMAVLLESAHEWLLDNPNNSILDTARHYDISESMVMNMLMVASHLKGQLANSTKKI